MSACVCACVYVWSTQHTYTHACIYALMHQCIHIKATVVCICTYIYKHTYRAHNTDMTCARIYITYIAWIHIIHTYMHNIHTCMPCIHALHTYITYRHAYLHRHTYIHLHAYTHRHDWLFSRCPILEELLKKLSANKRMELTTFVPIASQRKMQHETLLNMVLSTRSLSSTTPTTKAGRPM